MCKQDMEYLAEKAVDTSKANYAVVTGVQVSTPDNCYKVQHS